MQQHPRELAGNWLEQARRDLDAARYLFEGARYDAGFLRITASGGEGTQSRSHLACRRSAANASNGRTHRGVAVHRREAIEALGDLGALDPYYVTTRYPDAIGGGIPGSAFFAPERTLALDRAARAVDYVAGLLPSPDDVA